MITHYFTLLALRAEFESGLSGLAVREAFTQVKDELVLTLEGAKGVKSLVVSLSPRKNAIFYRDGEMRAKKNSAGIFPGIEGSLVGGFSLGGFSRILAVKTGDRHLMIHLFNSAASNVFFVDQGGSVVGAFRNGREFAGRAYGDLAGQPGAAAPAGITAGLLSDRSATVRTAVRKIFPHMVPPYLEELCFRAGTGPDAAVGGMSEAVAERIASTSEEFIEEANRGKAMLYTLPAGEEVLTVVELTHLRDAAVAFPPSVNAAAMDLFIRRKGGDRFALERKQMAETLERERKKAERSLREAGTILSGEPAEERYRRMGELILTHIHELKRGMTEADLSDPAAGGAPVRVTLDRALAPGANADRYFEKARNARRSREEASERVAGLRTRLQTYTGLLAELETCGDLRSLQEMKKKMKSDSGLPAGVRGEEQLPFRVFPVSGGFEVWVGKSSAGNDLLTGKYARPHDYWFHVRGASGSHVVLKRKGGKNEPVPKEALRAAARIAAYYSKMRKGGMVPVAYCERKYVKKPKNAPPGTVVLQREDILFVEPSLP